MCIRLVYKRISKYITIYMYRIYVYNVWKQVRISSKHVIYQYYIHIVYIVCTIYMYIVLYVPWLCSLYL